MTVADVPGAYLHTNFRADKHVVLKLQEFFVDIMCSINEDFKKDVMYERSKEG